MIFAPTGNRRRMRGSILAKKGHKSDGRKREEEEDAGGEGEGERNRGK